jgi:Lhr-like helicase
MTAFAIFFFSDTRRQLEHILEQLSNVIEREEFSDETTASSFSDDEEEDDETAVS